MFKRLDNSPAIARFFERFTTTIARQKGLPVVLGVGLVIISLLLQSLNVYIESKPLELIGIIVQHAGIIVGLLGLLLADALGR